jgi:hypothetical protein
MSTTNKARDRGRDGRLKENKGDILLFPTRASGLKGRFNTKALLSCPSRMYEA